MRSVISNRPNLVPSGLGNSATGFEASILGESGATKADRAEDDEDDSVSGSAEEDDRPKHWSASDKEDADNVSISSDITPPPSLKRRASKLEDKSEVQPLTSKATKPKPGKSAPAVKAQNTKKAKTAVEQFKDIAAAEEATIQERLHLKKAKVQSDSAIQLAKIKAKREIKLEETKAKAELAREKMRQDHEYRMASIRSSSQVPPMPDWMTPMASTPWNSQNPVASGSGQKEAGRSSPNSEWSMHSSHVENHGYSLSDELAEISQKYM